MYLFIVWIYQKSLWDLLKHFLFTCLNIIKQKKVLNLKALTLDQIFVHCCNCNSEGKILTNIISKDIDLESKSFRSFGDCCALCVSMKFIDINSQVSLTKSGPVAEIRGAPLTEEVLYCDYIRFTCLNTHINNT